MSHPLCMAARAPCGSRSAHAVRPLHFARSRSACRAPPVLLLPSSAPVPAPQLLVDCEGIDAFDQTADYSTQVFALGLLMSGLLIYNQVLRAGARARRGTAAASGRWRARCATSLNGRGGGGGGGGQGVSSCCA